MADPRKWVIHGEQVLMRRYRFTGDRWVWELPDGYVDDCEDPAGAAAREAEEGKPRTEREVYAGGSKSMR